MKSWYEDYTHGRRIINKYGSIIQFWLLTIHIIGSQLIRGHLKCVKKGLLLRKVGQPQAVIMERIRLTMAMKGEGLTF